VVVGAACAHACFVLREVCQWRANVGPRVPVCVLSVVCLPCERLVAGVLQPPCVVWATEGLLGSGSGGSGGSGGAPSARLLDLRAPAAPLTASSAPSAPAVFAPSVAASAAPPTGAASLLQLHHTLASMSSRQLARQAPTVLRALYEVCVNVCSRVR
jgi:hypothetical protein